MRLNRPIGLAASVTKSYRYFCHIRWHGREEYVREDIHINGIEGFWSYAKTWLYHYRGVPKQYFHLYLKEVEFRFNNRDKDLFHNLANLIAKLVEDV